MKPAQRVLLYLAVGTVVGLFSFARRYFDKLANDFQPALTPLLLDELTAAWLAALLIFVVVGVAQRFPIRRYWWIYLLAAPVYAVGHTLGMFLSRSALYPLFGLGSYAYGDLGYRFLMEAPVQLLGYGLTLVGVAIYGRLQKAHQAERLEGLLAEAQLERLRLSIAPHFLFNTLNAISAAVYESPEQADALIGRLARLLRALLAADVAQTCSLGRELELLEEYLALQQARFEDDLEVTIDCPEEVRVASVPFMLLQPVVENALEHGVGADGKVRVALSARHVADELVLEVRDRGPGPKNVQEGIGTRNTRERLARRYGASGAYELRPGAAGGAVARITVPWQPAS